MLNRASKIRRTLELNEDFYKTMRLPQSLYLANIDKVPEQVKPRIQKLLSKLDSALLEGVGACIYGPPGCGKSGTAAVIAKAARAREFSVRWATIWDLRESIKDGFYNNDSGLFDEIKNVDLLVIDQLKAGDFDEQKILPLREFIALIESRKQKNLSTILSLSDHPFQYGAQLPAILAAGRPGMVSVEVAGPDLRAAKTSTIETEYFGNTGF